MALKGEKISRNTTNLKILLTNIRSLRANFGSLELFLKKKGFDYDIITVTETWIDDEESYGYQLEGYTMVTQGRENKRSGGVALYYKNGIDCSHTLMTSNQCNAIKFKFPNVEGTITEGLLVYRFCRGNLGSFLTDLENMIFDMAPTSFILGDLNIDIRSTVNSMGYLNLLASQGFQSLLNTPTRITENSATCIDHFFARNSGITNKLNFNQCLSISQESVPFTDHDIIEIVFRDYVTLVEPKRMEYKSVDWTKVSERLACFEWNCLDLIEDIDEAFETFAGFITDTIAEETKIKTIPTRSSPRSPWISPLSIALADEQKKFLRLSKKFPRDTFYREKLKTLNKRLKNQIRIDKKAFYDIELENHAKNSKEYWRIIKKEITSKRAEITEIVIDGSPVKAPGNEKRIANAFNKHFTGVVSELIREHGEPPENKLVGLGRRNTSSFYFRETNTVEVAELIMHLKNTPSAGHDGITTQFLKNNADILAEPLSKLFNRSILSGVFPRTLKKAIIVPIFKEGEKNVISNYRPISLLSVISKLLEKVMHIRILKFLEKTEFLASNQYGFIPKKSVDLALIQHMGDIVDGAESGNKVIAVYCDIRRAFDTVNHEILLNKLESLGVRGGVWDWFSSYLSDRSQRVRVMGCLGDEGLVTHGVPQGSALGPLLFIIYVNDLLNLKMGGRVYSFADDTAIVYKAPTKESILDTINADMSVLKNWFWSHHLFLNLKKTKFMSFSHKTPLSMPEGITIHDSQCCLGHCNCPNIKQSETVRYLGLHLGQTLSWSEHTKVLQTRLRKLSFMIFHLSRKFSRKHVIRIYQAMMEPVLRFGIIHWGGGS